MVPGDTAVLVADLGDDREFAGGGMLYSVSASLARVDSIDLRAAAVSGVGPTVQAAAAGRDGKKIYVLIGNPKVGPLFPGQALRILVVDVSARRILRSFDVNSYGGGTMMVR